ncbi:hypothetical protein [Nocardia sp. NPDC049149]|uniref:hypothetical protein n=1 Tax=Nocardia sp. NPDC049149 TaxID=3364315 RepID=UPI003720B0AB
MVVATGRPAADGSPEVYNFWPWPKYDFVYHPRTRDIMPTVTDAVQITSIDTLDRFVNPPWVTQRPGRMFESLRPRLEIDYGRGPW